jgi:uncharacterized protein YjbI with pentapeptide repeats
LAILYHAVLDEANFREAHLNRAVLIGARGSHPIFTKGDLTEIYAPKAFLQRAQFNEANLESANLVAADLSTSNFNHANLTHANLQEANLQDATLVGADLTGARLNLADLRRTNLRGATLISVTGLTQVQLDAACVDEQTQLPPQLNRPAPCTLAKKEARP